MKCLATQIQTMLDAWAQGSLHLGTSFFFGGVVSWRSAKQSMFVTSTMEVDFEATIQALWLWNFTSRFGIANNIAELLRIYCDNSATIF